MIFYNSFVIYISDILVHNNIQSYNYIHTSILLIKAFISAWFIIPILSVNLKYDLLLILRHFENESYSVHGMLIDFFKKVLKLQPLKLKMLAIF